MAHSSRLQSVIRPYLFAVLLLLTVGGLLWLGSVLQPGYGFPWGLMSLLVITVTVSRWGTGPAVLVLALSIPLGDYLTPNLPMLSPHVPDQTWSMRLIRTLLFALCGGGIIWLTMQGRLMRERAERGREVVAALQSMILPERLAAAPGYDLGSVYRPAHEEDRSEATFMTSIPWGKANTAS